MQHKDADIVCTLLNISRHSYYTLSLFKIQHVFYNNFKPGVITPSISQPGQRAHENLSRGRGRSEKKKKKKDFSARHASRHLAQRLGEREREKKYSTRHAGIRLAQRLKIHRETRLEHSPQQRLKDNTTKTVYSRTVTGRERKQKRTIGFALGDGRA